MGVIARLAVSLAFLSTATRAAEVPGSVILREALVLDPVGGRAGRNTVAIDVVESRIVAGTWTPPRAGEELPGSEGRVRAWTNAVAAADGWFSGRAFRGGHAYFEYPSSESRVMVLTAAGHSMAYVNGEPRAGDVYGYGYVRLPIQLQPGTNQLLFVAGRGRLRVELEPPKSACFLNLGDPTTPDLITGQRVADWAAVVVVNATTNWADRLELRSTVEGRSVRTAVPPIPPLGVRKVGVRLEGPAPKTEGKSPVTLVLSGPGGRRDVLDSATLELRVRGPGQTHKRTFVSDIDGSVQYFAVNPGSGVAPDGTSALFLSLHGASVEAIGQADSYAPKRWGTIVCPTNRRPYAFDWEDWGRLDTLEVLDQAMRAFRPDPSRVYLTGHSMGGHGTWNVGVTFPDRFAAIAPSAGWISFFSYAGSDPFPNPTPVERMLRRAAASSDTLAMSTNHLQHGVYILHGDADDNVPVREARKMREVLGAFHRDFDWHEQPGAGHWWGNSDEPGSECVDWPPMFDFFARHRVPESASLRKIRFVTVNPGVSSRSHWLLVEGQEHAMEPTHVEAQWDPGLGRLIVTTSNARRLAFDAAILGTPKEGFRVEIDGQKLEGLRPEGRGTGSLLRIAKSGDRWSGAGELPAEYKNPVRSGPFKDAFRHRMIFVYGTRGTPEENAWALAKARFDAESFWYRGNGSPEVMPDTAFDAVLTRDRGVILYGHADMNAAWPLLMSMSPVQVRRGAVVVGDRRVEGDDLGCLFLQPRPGSATASVGVVAGSGLKGLRATQRLPYFMAGPGYPDLLLLGPGVWEQGTKGIVAAGFFGEDWSVQRGEFAWR